MAYIAQSKDVKCDQSTGYVMCTLAHTTVVCSLIENGSFATQISIS